MLLIQLICTAFDLAFAKAGNNIPANIAIIAITTSSSIKVKASLLFVFIAILRLSSRGREVMLKIQQL